jgi:hypothetical protein
MLDRRFVASRSAIDERADLAIGSLAPGGMGDLGGKEIAACFARRFRDMAAEFAALAVLVDIAADRQVPVFAPERLKQSGGRSKPRIERFVDPMFLEDVGRNERQLVNGRSQFRGHVACSIGYEANSGDSRGNLGCASDGQDF